MQVRPLSQPCIDDYMKPYLGPPIRRDQFLRLQSQVTQNRIDLATTGSTCRLAREDQTATLTADIQLAFLVCFLIKLY